MPTPAAPHTWRNALLVSTLVLVATTGHSAARAALINWQIDSTQSSIAISIRDGSVNWNIDSVSIKIRNPGNASSPAWTIGNSAPLGGYIRTEYKEVGIRSIEFLDQPVGGWTALDSANYRPNPAAFNSANTNSLNPFGRYQNNTTAPAPFGASIRLEPSTFGPSYNAYMTWRDVSFQLQSMTGAEPVAPGSGLFVGFHSLVGIKQLSAAFDNALTSAPFSISYLPDRPTTTIDNPLMPNQIIYGYVTELEGLDRQMRIPINVEVPIDLRAIGLHQTYMGLTGQVIAFATVPEPSSRGLAL